ncbi:MAG: cytidylate kinase-like family protein [Clostridia bacterium]|nr:cytidylate kinase-like family protein [Clostridia bacterium]
MDKKTIITIGRENGSGGRYIGEKLAQKLGINCYNNELISEIAKKYNSDLNYVEKNDEQPPEGTFYFGGQPIPAKVFEEQSSLIREIAQKESCVFIGRASDYVLKDFDNVINVFVHAPLTSRIERYSRRNNISMVEAEKEITKQDKKRASFYKFYTNQIWGEAKNYHICIDTSKVGIDGAVQLIENYMTLNNMNNDIIQ